MTSDENRIHLLDDISQSKIKYSVQISSLNDVVLELIKNALDAQARNIKVFLNYTHGFCSILDDGHGIHAEEFQEHGGLGKSYHTSKSGRASTSYGRNGRYLAALAGLSLLSIASRIRGGDTHVLWLNDTGRVRHAREPPGTFELETGTRIKVYGLFSELPVRRKVLLDSFADTGEVHKEFDKLRREVLGLVLAASVHFNICIEHTSPKTVYRHQWPKMEATSPISASHKSISDVVLAFRQAGILEPSQSHEWHEITIQSGDLDVHALIMKLPVASKTAQYISLNHLPLSKHAQPDLYQAINSLFGRSQFGSTLSVDTIERDGNQHLPGSRSHSKGVDKWPMFAIWINTTSGCVHDLLSNSAMRPQAQKLLTQIVDVIQSLIKEFLVVQGLSKLKKQRQSRALKTASGAGNLQATSTAKRLEQSKDSFRHWSRAKSSRASVLDNMLTGLPFHSKSNPKPADVPSTVLASPSTTEDSHATVVDSNESSPATVSIDDQENRDYGYIPWTDPQTGRVLRLDSRTGMELPHDRAISSSGNESSAGSRIAGLESRIGSSHQASRDLCIRQVAKNIRQYSTKRASRIDQPIKSISQFTHDGNELEHCCLTQKRKLNSFWGVNNFSHDSVRLEAPNLSKDALCSARVLRQVDRKFVLIMMRGRVTTNGPNKEPLGQLVLIDQHAADERCKVEALLRSLYSEKGIVLDSAIVFEVSSRETNLLDSARSYFAQWNILYEVLSKELSITEHVGKSRHQIKITTLPSAIAERCRLHPKLIIDILREGIYSDASVQQHHKTLEPIGPTSSSLTTTPLPPRLLEMINSRACRSSIMFNDILTTAQCETLIRQLSQCTLPFQCAHGRPSMVALTNISNLNDHRPLALQEREASSYFQTQSHDTHDTARNALNNIDESKSSFGDAYRSWIDSETND